MQEFLADRNLLAVKISSGKLEGLFKKTFTVPRTTSALAYFADGSRALFGEGCEVSGDFDLILAKRSEIHLRLVLPDMPSSDGMPVSATCGLVVELSLDREEFFQDFNRSLFTFAGSYSTADLKKHLAGEVRRLVSGYAAGRAAGELHRSDHAGPVAEILRNGLERFLFDAGVRFRKLLELSLLSAEYEKRTASEKGRAEEARQSAAVMERKEERVRGLARILKDDDVQGLLTKVPDERLKGLLYAKLMEDDQLQITAQELISKAEDCGEEVVQVIYKAMENLLSHGSSVASAELETESADRIFIAAGKKVLEVDPSTDDRPRVHKFPDPLRSVRFVETPDGPFLMGGAKKSVATVSLGNAPEVRTYPLPGGRSVRGGVNAIAFFEDTLYATHSEYGLVAWGAGDAGNPGEILWPEITKANRTTRAVQVDARGRILFASGHHVYAASPKGDDVAKYVSSVESSVTCIAAAPGTVFAGTENGSILCWKIDAPDQPVVLVRKRDAIINLRLAKICGIPHLIYSARDLSVRARVIGQSLETSYESGGRPIGVLDAASDLICASDADGRRVLLWKATSPSQPSHEIDMWKQAEKPVLDLWMKKVRSRSA